MPQTKLYRTVYAKACTYLARRDYSVLELYKRLERYFEKKLEDNPEDLAELPTSISNVVDDLQKERLLSNNRFVDEFIRCKLQRYTGPLLIQKQLHSKGITNELWLAKWSDYEASEFETCLRALRKWYNRQKADFDFDDISSRKKAERYLTGRGFYNHTVYECIQELAKESD